MYGQRTYGANYDANLKTKDIATLCRQFIKNDPELKNTKWSIRSDYNSIHAEMLEGAEPAKDDHGYTDYGLRMKEKVAKFLDGYNYDGSDIMTDYFDVNFYAIVQVAYKCKVVEPKKVEVKMNEDAKGEYQIIDYSEKAIAVIGDTRKVKDVLKRMGGRYNPKLTCGAGWIFAKRKQIEVQMALGM